VLFDPEDRANTFLRNAGKFPSYLHGVTSPKMLFLKLQTYIERVVVDVDVCRLIEPFIYVGVLISLWLFLFHPLVVCSSTNGIFLGWVKEVRTTKS
jgi:hypothetical protein